MHITRCKGAFDDSHFHNYNLGSNPLTAVDNYQLLGVYFSSNFSFNVHFDYICKRASRLVGFISRCTKGMPHDSFLLLYKTLVLPVLLYCGSVWIPSNVSHINRIEAIQRRATRIIYHRKFQQSISYPDRLKHFNIISVKDNLYLQRLTLGYKVVNNLCPADFSDYLHHSNLNSGRLLQWKTRSNAFYFSPFVHFTRLWNDLPLDVKDAPSVKIFRQKLFEHYLSNYWTFMCCHYPHFCYYW